LKEIVMRDSRNSWIFSLKLDILIFLTENK
jgi:hypothetical protein